VLAVCANPNRPPPFLNSKACSKATQHTRHLVRPIVSRCRLANAANLASSGCARKHSTVLKRSASTALGASRCTVEWPKVGRVSE
jgi:hypothetical protein